MLCDNNFVVQPTDFLGRESSAALFQFYTGLTLNFLKRQLFCQKTTKFRSKMKYIKKFSRGVINT